MNDLTVSFVFCCVALSAPITAKAQHVAGDDAATSMVPTSGSSCNQHTGGYIHVGKAIGGVATVEVVATLVAYTEDAVVADYSDGARVYDISVFEIVEPTALRGKQFQVLHNSNSERGKVWCSLLRTYSMLVDRDFIESEGFFGGPELVTIMEEKAL